MAIAALVLGLLAPPAALRAAPGDEPFTVRGVDVDVTAASAAAAREQAIAEGQRKAYRMLIQRLTGGADPERAPRPEGADLARLVQGFEVEEERASSVRYVGTLAVSFRPAPVRALLRNAGVRYTDVRSKPVLVLPVDQTGADPVLWERATPWRAAWEAIRKGGLVPLEIPPGDAADQADATSAQAAAGDVEALGRLGRRYAVRQVAVARLMADGTVQLARAAPGDPLRFEGVPVPPAPADVAGQSAAAAAAAALKRAMTAADAVLEQDWARANLVDAGVQGVIAVRVPIDQLDGFIELRRRLAAVSTVTAARLMSLSRGEALLELHHLGEAQKLRTALAQQNLALNPRRGDAAVPWELRLNVDRPAAVPAAAPAAPAAASEPAAAR
jgi:hypothetical protein